LHRLIGNHVVPSVRLCPRWASVAWQRRWVVGLNHRVQHRLFSFRHRSFFSAFACCATFGRASPHRSRAKQNSRAIQAKPIFRPYSSSDEARGAASPVSGGGGGAAAGGGGGVGSVSGGGGGGVDFATGGGGGGVGFASGGGATGAGVVTGGSGWPSEPGNADPGLMFGLTVDGAACADPGAGEDSAPVDGEGLGVGALVTGGSG